MSADRRQEVIGTTHEQLRFLHFPRDPDLLRSRRHRPAPRTMIYVLVHRLFLDPRKSSPVALKLCLFALGTRRRQCIDLRRRGFLPERASVRR